MKDLFRDGLLLSTRIQSIDDMYDSGITLDMHDVSELVFLPSAGE
jgi:hypothetical protein